MSIRGEFIKKATNLANKYELPTPQFEKMTLEQIIQYYKSLKDMEEVK